MHLSAHYQQKRLFYKFTMIYERFFRLDHKSCSLFLTRDIASLIFLIPRDVGQFLHSVLRFICLMIPHIRHPLHPPMLPSNFPLFRYFKYFQDTENHATKSRVLTVFYYPAMSHKHHIINHTYQNNQSATFKGYTNNPIVIPNRFINLSIFIQRTKRLMI